MKKSTVVLVSDEQGAVAVEITVNDKTHHIRPHQMHRGLIIDKFVSPDVKAKLTRETLAEIEPRKVSESQTVKDELVRGDKKATKTKE